MKSTNEKPRICLDMDEVIADTYAKFSRLYADRYGKKISRATYQSRQVRDIPEVMALREEYFKPGFFRDLPLMPNAVEVVRELHEDYDIWITTAAAEFKHSLADKYEWLEEHFSFIPWQRYVFCGDKSILRGDYMIDDKVYNLNSFVGQGLHFTAGEDMVSVHHTQVKDWLAVRAFFKSKI